MDTAAASNLAPSDASGGAMLLQQALADERKRSATLAEQLANLRDFVTAKRDGSPRLATAVRLPMSAVRERPSPLHKKVPEAMATTGEAS